MYNSYHNHLRLVSTTYSKRRKKRNKSTCTLYAILNTVHSLLLGNDTEKAIGD